VEHDLDAACMTSQRLVDRVVDDFVDHVMQAGAVIGVTDIHAWPLANGIKALQDPDRLGAVFGRNGMLSVGDGLPGRFCHVKPSRMYPVSGTDRGAEGLYLCHEKGPAHRAKAS